METQTGITRHIFIYFAKQKKVGTKSSDLLLFILYFSGCCSISTKEDENEYQKRFHPPPFAKLRKHIAIGLSVLLVAAGLSFAAINANTESNAASLIKGDVTAASSGGIVLDTNLYSRQPTWNVSNIDRSDKYESGQTHDDGDYTYWYPMTTTAGTYTTLGKDITATWTNCGFDNANNRIDLVMTFKSDSRFWSTTQGTWVALLSQYPQNQYGTAGWCLTPGVWKGSEASSDLHVQLNFYKTGTKTPAVGSFFSIFTDLDMPGWENKYGNEWDEGIEFISGHGSMYIPTNSVLRVTPNRNNEANTWFRATQRLTGSSMIGGVATNLSNGANFWWRGWQNVWTDSKGATRVTPVGSTDVLDSFNPHTITTSAGAGGSVKCGSLSGTIPVGWRCGRTITITPNTGYHVVDVKVNGTSVGAKTSYTFSNVTTNQTISATFALNTYNVRFLDSLNNNAQIGSTQSIKHGKAATAPTPPAHTGYTFSGWNKTFNSITANTDVTALYTPNKYNIAYNANGGTNTMPNQAMTYGVAANLTTNAFTRLDYDWAGWNSAANGSGTAYTQNQSVKNLTATANGTYTMYAQWKPHTNASMSFEKTSDKDTYTVGDVVKYTFKVTNTGDITLGQVKVTDERLGIHDEVIAEKLACGETITATHEYGPLTEEEVTVHSISNTATATSTSFLPELNDPAPVESSTTAELVSDPQLVIEKTASAERLDNAHAGDIITYTVTARNEGNITLSELNVQDVLSNGKELELAFDKDVIAPGQMATATVDYALTQNDIDAGSISNSATGTAKDPSRDELIEGIPGAANTEIARNESLSFEKTAGTDTTNIGSSIGYNFKVTNTGNVTLRDVKMTDVLVNVSDEVIAEVLAPGQSVDVHKEYLPVTEVDAIAGKVINTAYVSAGTPEGVPAIEDVPASAEVTVKAKPHLSISKTVDNPQLDKPVAGTLVEYNIRVINSGDITINDIVVEDTLSNGKQIELGEYPTALAPDEAFEIRGTYVLTQEDIDAGGISNKAIVRGMSPAGDEPVESESEDIPSVFDNAPEMSVELSVDKDSAEVLDALKYVATVTNIGNVTLQDAVLHSTLLDRDFKIDGTLATGQSIEIPFEYTEVTQGDAVMGGIASYVTATAKTPQNEEVTGSADVFTSVKARPSVHIVSAVDKTHIEQAHPGDVLVYSYTAENTGNIYLNGILVPSFMNGTSHFPVEFPLDRFDAGAETSFGAEYALTQEDIDRGYVENVISISGVEPAHETTVQGNTEVAHTDIDRHPAVTIVKTAQQERADIGDVLEYTICVENTGDVTLRNVMVNDALVGMENHKVADVLAPGESVTVEARYDAVDADDAIAGKVVNIASANAKTPEGLTDATSEDSAETTIDTKPAIHLVAAVDKTKLDDPHAGDILAYTYTASNTGNIYLGGVQLPSFMTGSKVFPLQFPLEFLDVAQNENIEATYAITQDDIDRGYIENTTSISGIDPANGNKVDGNEVLLRTELGRNPACAMEKKAHVDSAEIGDAITYTVVVENTGNTTLRDVTVSDPLTGDMQKLAAKTLAPGESCEVDVTYQAVTESDAQAGQVENVAYATCIPPDGMSEKVEGQATETVLTTATPQMKVEKRASASSLDNAKAGDEIEWTFEISNTGNVRVNDVMLIDEMLSTAGYDLTLPFDTLAAGEKKMWSIKYKLTQEDIDAGSIDNVAKVTGKSTAADGAGVEAESNTAHVDIKRMPALAIDKEVSKESAKIGDELEYTVTVTNTGNTTLTEIWLTDAAFGRVLVAASMAPGESITLDKTIVVSEDDAVLKLIESPAQVVAESPDADNPPAPAEDYVETAIESNPSMEIVKWFNVEESMCHAGDEIEWVVEITNTGDITLGDIEIEDEMLSTAGYVFDVSEDMKLVPGDVATLKCKQPLTQEHIDAGEIENIAKATAVAADGKEAESNESRSKAELERQASIEVEKRADTGYIANSFTGNVITYEIEARNTGNVTMTGVEVVDELDGAKVTGIEWASEKEGILAPGENVVATVEYAVTETDIERGEVVNTAHVEMKLPEGVELIDGEKVADGDDELFASMGAEAKTVLVAPEDTGVADEILAAVDEVLVKTGDGGATGVLGGIIVGIMSVVACAIVAVRKKVRK